MLCKYSKLRGVRRAIQICASFLLQISECRERRRRLCLSSKASEDIEYQLCFESLSVWQRLSKKPAWGIDWDWIKNRGISIPIVRSKEILTDVLVDYPLK